MAKKSKNLPQKYKAGFLREIDGRTEVYQRLNSAYGQIIEDLGGVEQLSHVKRALIERFVFNEELLRQMEAQLLDDPPSASEVIGKYTQMVNALQGLAKVIGLKRIPRDITLKP